MNRFPRKTGNFSRKANFWFGPINWRLSELSEGRDYRVYIFTYIYRRDWIFQTNNQTPKSRITPSKSSTVSFFGQNLIAGGTLLGAKSGQSMSQVSHLAPPDQALSLRRFLKSSSHQTTHFTKRKYQYLKRKLYRLRPKAGKMTFRRCQSETDQIHFQSLLKYKMSKI